MRINRHSEKPASTHSATVLDLSSGIVAAPARLRSDGRRALAALMLAGAMAVAAQAATTSFYGPGWSTAHADNANTDYSPVRGAANLTLAWQRSLDGAINLGATSDAEQVYITTTSASGQLYALDRTTGATRWFSKAFDRSAVASSAQLDRDGRIFLADSKAMRAFKPNGEELWSTPIVGFPLSAQFTRAGHLIFITHIGRIYVLRRETGAPVLAPLELIPGATFDPTADPRPCMKGTGDCPSSNTLAIDLETDRFYFTFWTPGQPTAGVRAMQFVDGPQPALVPLWINDGLTNGSAASPDLSPDNSRLYLTDNGGQLIALSTANGAVIWRFNLGYEAGGSVSTSPEGIIMPAGGGQSPLMAVQDKGDHAEELWRRTEVINRGIPTQVAGGLAYATVVAPNQQGQLDLIVVETATGRELDRERLPGQQVFSVGTTIGLDGTVYVPTITGDLFAFRGATQAGHQGPVIAASDAFGGHGPYAVTTETFPSPGWPEQVVSVFLPQNAPGRRPVWFFAHGFAGTNPAFYRELIDHLASHGAVVIFSPYPADLRPANDYPIIFDGFAAAVDRFAERIDLRRVGFLGHSFGGGAVPSLALRGLRERGWGAEGMALCFLAPWYLHSVSTEDLASFPAGTQAVVQVYEDDTINDHRMAIDLFTHLKLPADDKAYLMVRSDRIDGYNYPADHNVPTGAGNPRGGLFNATDSWGVFRLAQALADSVWRNDPAARAVVLGHGSTAQLPMGATTNGRALRPMIESRAPVPLFPSSRYLQKWDSPLNPRRNVRLPSNPSHPHLSNLSARAQGASGADTLIVGATVTGPRPDSLLIRAVGPGLSAFGVANPMSNPRLVIYRGSTVDLDLDDWSQAPTVDALTAATGETGAFTLADNSTDASLLASFAPGSLTAQAVPGEGTAGVVLLELYEADGDEATALNNLSARARIGAGENVLAAGFVVVGEGSLGLLVRGIGPALTGLGVADALTDPELIIYRGAEQIAVNNNWSADASQTPAIAAAARTVGAFPLTNGSADASILITLPAGAYTAQLQARDGRLGTGLIEVYVVP